MYATSYSLASLSGELGVSRYKRRRMEWLSIFDPESQPEALASPITKGICRGEKRGLHTRSGEDISLTLQEGIPC